MAFVVTRIASLSSRLLIGRSTRISRPFLPTASCNTWRHQSFSSEATATKEELLGPTHTGQEDSKVYPDHIENLVDTISKLSLMEVADLNELLKKRLGIEGGTMMPMMGGMAGFPQAAQDEDGDEEAPAAVKSSFNVRLMKFDPTRKVPLIKELKILMPDMNLVQAKKFVEAAPDFVKKEVSKDEAEELKKALEAVGGTVEIE